jgi:CSLREA domain-containing protein
MESFASAALRATRDRWYLAPLLAAAVFGLAACHGGPHLDLTVNTTGDGLDATPGDGTCEMTTGAGDCSLRAAIDEVNATPDAEAKITLTVDPELTLAGGAEDANATGDLDVTGDITIAGGGHTIDGNGVDRVLDVHGATLRLDDTTITGGLATAPEALTGGGAVRVVGGSITLMGSRLTGNETSSHRGAALLASEATNVVVAQSEIDANSSNNGGGAIDARDTDRLVLSESDIHDNGAALKDADGVYVFRTNATILDTSIARSRDNGIHVNQGTLDIDGSSITENVGHGLATVNSHVSVQASTFGANISHGVSHSGSGGGLTIDASDLVGNRGGLEVSGASVTVNDSTIADNDDDYGAGIKLNGGSVTLNRSTVSGNTAVDGGGGIWASLGTSLTVNDSTISGNSAGTDGGGLYLEIATVSLTRSTITDNDAALDGDGALVFTSGGPYSSTVTVKGSIVGDSCKIWSASGYSSQGRNLGSDTTCNLTHATDQTSIDPLLGPLVDNGGPTLTHLPAVGSPAREAIPAGAAGLCDGTVPADQRGVARPQGAACDIGSVEQ